MVSTDRTLTGGVTGTVPVSTGITIGTSPSLSRHTTSTETLQFTEYPTGGDASAATAAGNASSTGLTEALLALDEGLRRQQDTGGPPCFSPAPSDKADISPIGPNEITFATNASRTATGGLALTIGIIAFNATGQKTDNRGTTITIVFSPDHPPDAMPRPPEHRKPPPSPH
ncbi:hypothetical protein [Tanticharoenia sakaeratensis]|uniref:Uncharacterized protein n=1 Tax=Tanticharoenia sakaeratensis NBRC 103193 TaxID=1231623 RepID=A0A0D6MQ01_9PROT|nr:hypothetical protein [Tanticharoenia sakaeratensis]GAN55368.1 hypothetical protein Tasa_047_013 [Tanticharoenia sakaeratensis NBRC 103193]GBQ16580.1 hypothetical protein AA103193_0036 [Tanticharoenia sakaeratensis NBRC 103193]